MRAALVLLLAAPACSDPAPGGPPSPTAGTVSAARDPGSAAGAVAAYQAMWQAYVKAGLTANPDEPDLARYAVGAALKTLRDGLRGYRIKNQVLKGDLVTNPQVTAASPGSKPTTVTITDCLNTAGFLAYRADGRLVDDVPGGQRAARATVNLGPDGWKVASFGVQAVDTC